MLYRVYQFHWKSKAESPVTISSRPSGRVSGGSARIKNHFCTHAIVMRAKMSNYACKQQRNFPWLMSSKAERRAVTPEQMQ
jgi:hypothetical protein